MCSRAGWDGGLSVAVACCVCAGSVKTVEFDGFNRHVRS